MLLVLQVGELPPFHLVDEIIEDLNVQILDTNRALDREARLAARLEMFRICQSNDSQELQLQIQCCDLLISHWVLESGYLWI